MADVLTPEQRSYCMSRIRDRNTEPELVVRKLVHALGYRYRLHDKRLPGKPDLVFAGRRKVIFVHGCFWHRHNCRFGRVRARTNADFWEKKIRGNTIRDKRTLQRLAEDGWKVLVVWECQTQARRREKLLERIVTFLEK